MRKRNFSFAVDLIIWAIITMLPIIFYLFSFTAYDLSTVSSLPTFADFLSSNFSVITDSVIYTGLVDLFGSTGILPLIDSNAVFMYFSWFIITEIVHLAVDFLVFIPRLAHKFMHKLYDDD